MLTIVCSWGFPLHAPMLCFLNSLSDWLRDRLIIQEMRRVVAIEQARGKQ